MKKKILFFSLLILILIAVVAYLNDPAKQTSIRTDKKISYEIIQRGYSFHNNTIAVIFDKGANFESKDQIGLTHCMEHLMFKGTKHFPNDSILKYIRSQGGKLGITCNAYTSRDYVVVYFEKIKNKNKDIPDAYFEYIKDILDHQLTLNSEDLKTEKNVITEEFNRYNNEESKTASIINNWIFGNSKHHNTRVLGDYNQIQQFNTYNITNYYHHWLDHSNIKIVALGDLNIEKTLQKMKKYFGKDTTSLIKNHKEEIKTNRYTSHPVQTNEIYTILDDYQIQLILPSLNNETAPSFENISQNKMIQILLSNRFIKIKEILSDYCSHFDIQSYSTLLQSQQLIITYLPLKNQPINIHKEILLHIRNLYQDGFTKDEISKAKEELTSQYNTKRYKQDIEWIFEITSYFKTQIAYDTSPYIPWWSNKYTDKKINELFKAQTKQSPIYLIHQGSKASNPNLNFISNFYLSKDQPSSQISTTVKTYKNVVDTLAKGEIISKQENKEAHMTTWQLSNQMEISYQKIDMPFDEFHFNAYKKSYNTSLDLFIAYMINHYVGMPNEEYYTNTLNSIRPKVMYSITPNYITIDGEKKGSCDLIFKHLLERSSLSTIDKETFQREKQKYIYKKTDALKRFNAYTNYLVDSLTDTHLVFNEQILHDFSYEEFLHRYKSYYSNLASFKLMICGTLDPDQVEESIEENLCAIPKALTTNDNIVHRTFDIFSPRNKVVRRVNAQNKEFKLQYCIRIPFKYSRQNIKLLNFYYRTILHDRLSNELRTKRQITYAVNVSTQSSYIEQSGDIDITVRSQSKNRDQIIRVVEECINKPLTKTEFKKAKKLENNYSSDIISNYYFDFFSQYFYKTTPIIVETNRHTNCNFKQLNRFVTSWKDKKRVMKVLTN
ncbi:insulinase family protein [Halosquirtibacter xylanolyticus]|uniref:insulinase family protein n=1 Tax=Halosquirtibacter xylanolyticus TaxID=3374599 RepID=UPI0037484485|nr:insulinase family protein [Prolixibacteraceae bacterium]